MANVKHRTLNIQSRMGDGFLSMLDVGRLAFIVRYLDFVRSVAWEAVSSRARSAALLLVTFFSSTLLSAADRFDHHSLPPTGNEEAVLVLCPGMNGDGGFFLEETPWREFADQHDLGLVAIHYTSPAGPMYSEARQGYYWPEQGSGEALLAEIREVYGEDLPILLYGFSGGAHFASRFVEWVPERVVAWSAYSAQFWDSPTGGEILPLGIVACGERDGVRWFPSFAYFYEGRRLGKPWAWVSLADTGHTRNGPFEGFVRDFFTAVLDEAGMAGRGGRGRLDGPRRTLGIFGVPGQLSDWPDRPGRRD